jgi:hypothetical protein
VSDAFTQAASDLGRRWMFLSERLCCAFSKKHGGVTIVSRELPDGRRCEYPVQLVEEAPDIDAVPGLREERDRLAAEFYALTDFEPDACMVVCQVEGLAARVEYERKPEEWR